MGGGQQRARWANGPEGAGLESWAVKLEGNALQMIQLCLCHRNFGVSSHPAFP